MLQSIHAILHNILQKYSTVLDSAYYSTIRITILMLQCSCEQIYFQAFLFQNCIAETPAFYIQLASSFHMKCTVCRNNILLGELQFFSLQSITPRLHSVYILLDSRQSTCTQTTCSLHPLESTTQPTHKNLSSWRTCRFYRKKPKQYSAQPGQEFYQKKS